MPTPETPAPPPDVADVEARLLAFLHRELAPPGETVGRDDDLLGGEILDSIGVVRFAAFVEQDFGLSIRPADLVIENFRTVAVLAAFVRNELAGRSDG